MSVRTRWEHATLPLVFEGAKKSFQLRQLLDLLTKALEILLWNISAVVQTPRNDLLALLMLIVELAFRHPKAVGDFASV